MENTSSPLKAKIQGIILATLRTLMTMKSPFVRCCPTRLGRLIKSKPNMNCRQKLEFISEEKTDTSYWEKHRKNNEAAKRSHEKQHLNDMVL